MKIKIGKPYPRLHKLFCPLLFLVFVEGRAQQYNSDSWFCKQKGTITIIPTLGQRSSMLMNTYSLFARWEFTVAAYLYNTDNNAATNDGYSASLYAKYMIYENKSQTGGIAVKAGTGMFPGTIDAHQQLKDAFKTYWMNVPATIPFFNNRLSWDIMPGTCVTVNHDESHTPAWGFTYSSRLAWYPFSPEASIVGEVFGTAGPTGAIPEYKIGLRWEPSQYAVFAITYGHEFAGGGGAGFEAGVMLFTPPFACLGGCGTKKKTDQ
jgi:hypothetical protein